MNGTIVSDFHNFDFDKLALAPPHAVQGGTYFTKLSHAHKPLYIQTPRSLTKQGITRTEHKVYADLVFAQSDNDFISWLESLENKLQALIYGKRTTWFHNDLEMNDIENAFTPLVRTFRSGKNYVVRCSLGKTNGAGLKNEIKIFNEAEDDIRLDDIKPDNAVITILEVAGIRFSTRSFHVDLHVKQLMVFQAESPFESCLIRPGGSDKGGDAVQDDGETDSVSSLSDIEDADDTETSDPVEAESESERGACLSDDTKDAGDPGANAGDCLSPSEAPPSGETPVGSGAEEAAGEASVQDSAQERDADLDKSLDKTQPVAGNENDTKDLEEVELDTDDLDEEIRLKDPNEVYMQIYMDAREKAKLAKKAAIEAYLEAKKIKNTYLLEEIDESDEEEMFNFSEK